MGDSLLVSSHEEGFTAIVLHDAQPVIIRSILCDPEDMANELYRLILFYRDRIVGAPEMAEGQSIERLMVCGNDGFTAERVERVVSETLGVDVSALDAQRVGLSLPSNDISFDAIAAPAGLATLAWG